MLQYHLSFMTHISRGIAQLVEHWSPKPGVVGSSPATPAKTRLISELWRECAAFSLASRSECQGFFRGGEIFGAAVGCAFLDFSHRRRFLI